MIFWFDKTYIMIIRYPTGFYNSVLPHRPNDGGNVTYLISTTEPPRGTPLSVTSIPSAIKNKTNNQHSYTKMQRRGMVGDKIFSITKTGKSRVSSSKKQFESGQLLDFDDVVISNLNPMLVGVSTEIRHDTNKLDLQGIGLTSDQVLSIEENAFEKLAVMQGELLRLHRDRLNAETLIVENNKTQNETKKAINAIKQLIESTPSLQGALDTLEHNLIELQSDCEKLISDANENSLEASVVSNNILELSEVIR